MVPALGFGGRMKSNIPGVFLVIVAFAMLTCLADNKNNVTDNNSTSTHDGDKKTEEEEGSLFSTEFKIFLGLAAVATGVAVIACLVIKKKGENQYARGENMPSPIVGLSHKF